MFIAAYRTKYRTDLEEFIRTSSFEDFYDDNEETIYISTIHKSKGREFDSVYMMLKHSHTSTDEEKRKIYVGMTRAKKNLYIHVNTAMFDSYDLSGIPYITDTTMYPEPQQIVLQTTYRDVVLDFFKGKNNIICALYSGQKLKIQEGYVLAEIHDRDVRVAKFSKAFCETMNKLNRKGYLPYEISVRFIVEWKGKDDEEETPILLMNIKYHMKITEPMP